MRDYSSQYIIGRMCGKQRGIIQPHRTRVSTHMLCLNRVFPAIEAPRVLWCRRLMHSLVQARQPERPYAQQVRAAIIA